MRYLITGGAGFIGSYLSEKLIARGDEVLVLDDLSTGARSNISSNGKIQFIQGSILDKSKIKSVISDCDYILHLAAAVGVFNIVGKPLRSILTNVIGTEMILEVADEYKKPILIVSSSEIYGRNHKVPLSEEDDRVLGSPLKARWSYGEAKAIDESLSFFYYLENKLEVRIVRLFNTVGPRQVGTYGMVLPRFIDSALQNKPLQVYGSGEQIRCFCHIDDAVKALLLVIDSEETIGSVFNIGNNEEISILELAKKVIKITNSQSKIVKVPYSVAYPEGFEDMMRRVPDITKIESVLGWKPQIDLDHIIADIASLKSK
jgi:UDP-glucose 4-epimerase